MKSLTRIVLIAISSLFLIGCVTTVRERTAETVAYIRGDLKSGFDKPVKKLNQAVMEMADNFEFIVYQERTDALSGSFEYENAQEDSIVIKTKQVDANSSDIMIRIGLLGDEELSIQILEEIQRELN